MRARSVISFVGGILLAMTGLSGSASAAAEKLFISGNHTTCQDVFDALSAQHGISHGGVRTEISVSPLSNGPGTTIIGSQTVNIYGVDPGQTSFSWEETTPTGDEGFDVVSIKAGNGRSVYVYNPDSTGDTGLQDLNTTQKIGQVLICSDDITDDLAKLPTCGISAETRDEICALIESDPSSSFPAEVVFGFQIPGDGATTQRCACPGVTAAVCTPGPVCDPAAEDCSGYASFCDPTGATPCCSLSPISGEPLTVVGTPSGTTFLPANGSSCSLETNFGGDSLSLSLLYCTP